MTHEPYSRRGCGFNSRRPPKSVFSTTQKSFPLCSKARASRSGGVEQFLEQGAERNPPLIGERGERAVAEGYPSSFGSRSVR